MNNLKIPTSVTSESASEMLVFAPDRACWMFVACRPKLLMTLCLQKCGAEDREGAVPFPRRGRCCGRCPCPALGLELVEDLCCAASCPRPVCLGALCLPPGHGNGLHAARPGAAGGTHPAQQW